MEALSVAQEQALWDRIMTIPFHECWEWVGCFGGSKDASRGKFSFNGKTRQAHRVTYEHLIGPIPDGLVLDHKCKNVTCVRPEHLEPVTQIENMRRERKSHCSRNHRLTDDNLYIHPKRGWRECLTCRNIRNAARRKKTESVAKTV